MKRALFLVSAGPKQDEFLEKVDTSRCVLVKESPPFVGDFDIWLDPLGGCSHVPSYKTMTVKLLIYYSVDEYNRVFSMKRSALRTHISGHKTVLIFKIS
jgi:hypothetical protein